MRFRELRLRQDPECARTGACQKVRGLIDYEAFCGIAAPAAAASAPGDIAPVELAARLANHDDLLIVDVREPHEWDICHLEGARLVPLRTLPDVVETLPRDRTLVVHCKLGGRSAKAAEFLRARGFDRVLNLTGGIRAWTEQVDPTLRKY
jgi:adenylyltransferase/sulfurtransferase